MAELTQSMINREKGGDAALRFAVNTIRNPDERFRVITQLYPNSRIREYGGTYVIEDTDPDRDPTKPVYLFDPDAFDWGDVASGATSALPMLGGTAGGVGGGVAGTALTGNPAGTIAGSALGGAGGAELGRQANILAADRILKNYGVTPEREPAALANMTTDALLGAGIDAASWAGGVAGRAVMAATKEGVRQVVFKAPLRGVNPVTGKTYFEEGRANLQMLTGAPPHRMRKDPATGQFLEPQPGDSMGLADIDAGRRIRYGPRKGEVDPALSMATITGSPLYYNIENALGNTPFGREQIRKFYHGFQKSSVEGLEGVMDDVARMHQREASEAALGGVDITRMSADDAAEAVARGMDDAVDSRGFYYGPDLEFVRGIDPEDFDLLDEQRLSGLYDFARDQDIPMSAEAERILGYQGGDIPSRRDYGFPTREDMGTAVVEGTQIHKRRADRIEEVLYGDMTAAIREAEEATGEVVGSDLTGLLALRGQMVRDIQDAPRSLAAENKHALPILDDAIEDAGFQFDDAGQLIINEETGLPEGVRKIPFETIKRIRSTVRRKMDNIKWDEYGGTGPDDRNMQRIYSTLTDEMERAAQEAGDDVYFKWKTANDYTAQEMIENADIINDIKRKKIPNQVFNYMMEGTKGGVSRLDKIFNILPNKHRDFIREGVFAEMGFRNQAGQVMEAWSPDVFVTNYGKLSRDARKFLLNNDEEFVQSMDQFAEAMQLNKAGRAYGNPSGTGGQVMFMDLVLKPFTGIMGGVGAMAGYGVGQDMAAAAAGAAMLAAGSNLGTNQAARLITSKSFVDWVLEAGQKQFDPASGQYILSKAPRRPILRSERLEKRLAKYNSTVKSHLQRLATIAAENPELELPIMNYAQDLQNEIASGGQANAATALTAADFEAAMAQLTPEQQQMQLRPEETARARATEQRRRRIKDAATIGRTSPFNYLDPDVAMQSGFTPLTDFTR